MFPIDLGDGGIDIFLCKPCVSSFLNDFKKYPRARCCRGRGRCCGTIRYWRGRDSGHVGFAVVGHHARVDFAVVGHHVRVHVDFDVVDCDVVFFYQELLFHQELHRAIVRKNSFTFP